jgi:hypothetical protein
MDPFGLRMARGEAVRRRLRTGQSWKKWEVLPVSAMTLGGTGVVQFVVVGGPTGVSSNGGSAKVQVGIGNDEL